MAPTQNGEKPNNGAGVGEVNGPSHATSTSSIDTAEKLASKAKPQPGPLKLKPTNPDRQGIANALERYGQVIHAKGQPLPNQVGPGSTFTFGRRWGSLRDDFKTLRFAGAFLTKGFSLRDGDGSGLRADTSLAQTSRRSRNWPWPGSRAGG